MKLLDCGRVCMHMLSMCRILDLQPLSTNFPGNSVDSTTPGSWQVALFTQHHSVGLPHRTHAEPHWGLAQHSYWSGVPPLRNPYKGSYGSDAQGHGRGDTISSYLVDKSVGKISEGGVAVDLLQESKRFRTC